MREVKLEQSQSSRRLLPTFSGENATSLSEGGLVCFELFHSLSERGFYNGIDILADAAKIGVDLIVCKSYDL